MLILEIAAGIVLAFLILIFIRPILFVLFWAAAIAAFIVLLTLVAHATETVSLVQPVIRPTVQTVRPKDELIPLCEELGGVQVAIVLVGRDSSGKITSIKEVEIKCEKRRK